VTASSLLSGWSVPEVQTETRIRKYSTTGDILAFRRCRRQYGYFSVRGFSSTGITLRYFGVLVHDVLDQIRRDFDSTGLLPEAQEVAALVGEAHYRLVQSGIRPLSEREQREKAVRIISRFVRLVGPAFFPRVAQSEFRLECALKTHLGRPYVLEGIVDVVAGAVSHELGLPFSTRHDDIEIWDYKSEVMPHPRSRAMRDYEFQMRVYAELFRQQTGSYPARCVLVFAGELDCDRWNNERPSLREFPRLVHVVAPTTDEMVEALTDFHHTVEAIEAERALPYADQWLAPDHEPGDETCPYCDLRFSCATFRFSATHRQIPL
jgi:hypothetical protein